MGRGRLRVLVVCPVLNKCCIRLLNLCNQLNVEEVYLYPIVQEVLHSFASNIGIGISHPHNDSADSRVLDAFGARRFLRAAFYTWFERDVERSALEIIATEIT